ncbi:MAG: HesB/IscA family protein [Planctomycetia bacterium]
MSITLTPKAAEKVRAMMAAPGQEAATGLRIKVVGGGCSGLSYEMALERSAGPADKVCESEGVRVFLDPKSALFVSGTQVDYHESVMGQGFAFKNPNAKGTCGCGTSFTA